MQKIARYLKVANTYIVQYDFHRYLPSNPTMEIEKNKEYAKNPIEADSIEKVKEILKSQNKNPFYFVIIPKDKFTKGVITDYGHPYVKFNQ